MSLNLNVKIQMKMQKKALESVSQIVSQFEVQELLMTAERILL
jgi:hypothetical protein